MEPVPGTSWFNSLGRAKEEREEKEEKAEEVTLDQRRKSPRP